MKKLSCYITIAICLPIHVASIAQCNKHPALNSWERSQFIEAAYGPRSLVNAQILSELGCGKPMMAALEALGVTARFESESLGYALVSIARDKILNTLDFPGIEYAYTYNSANMYYQDSAARIQQGARRAESVPPIIIPNPHLPTSLSSSGPYFEADQIGLTRFWVQHPEGDGRGVRVAVLDSGFDLLHPALQQAKDASGRTVAKVADLGTLTSPDEDSGWVQFSTPIRTQESKFQASGRTWIAPEDGIYYFGIFRTDLVLGQEENSYARKLSLSVGVLWDKQGGNVWVDTDGDGSFKNQRRVGDYGVTHEIDWFGKKEGAEDHRIPFGVKIDPDRNAVFIRIGDSHGTLVAGALGANKLTGGLFDGAAPGAQIIDSNQWKETVIANVVESMAASDVDIINLSAGFGRVPYPGRGLEGLEDFAQRVAERAIAVYQKPLVAVTSAAGTISVGDFAGSEMLRRNRQLAPPYRDTINGFVSYNSSGLVNSVLAPSANLETASRYKPYDILWPDEKRHSFTDTLLDPPAPEGYMIGDNNSPAIPVVSGVLADLISEARREHVQYNAVRLNNAIFTGARLLPGFPVAMQGYGLIDAPQSWKQLTKMAKADDPANNDLTTFTVSRNDAGHRITVQGFYADLPKPGSKLESDIWITRHGGYAGPRQYSFSLRGENESYELLDQEALLKRDVPVRVRFRTNGASGRNIAFVELKDVAADVVMQDVPLSVRVPDLPTHMARGVDEYRVTIPPLSRDVRYISIGENEQAERYVMKIPYTGPSSISARYFPGYVFREQTGPSDKPIDAAHHIGPIETLESLVKSGRPRTQEVGWENCGGAEYATQYDGPCPDMPIQATLTIEKYAIAITKSNPQVIAVTNNLADVKGRVELFDARIVTSEISGKGNHAMAEVDHDVPAGLVEWRVRVTGAVKGAHEDAYLLNCAGRDGCLVVSQQEITNRGAVMVVDNPQVGKWKIIIRSREPVAAGALFHLKQAELSPASGDGAESDVKRISGERWALALPRSARYAAFRIAGTPGVEPEKEGVLIAMTPLAAALP